jgi:hypothetical protein
VIQRFKRWWYRIFGAPNHDVIYLLDTDEYMLEKEGDETGDS